MLGLLVTSCTSRPAPDARPGHWYGRVVALEVADGRIAWVQPLKAIQRVSWMSALGAPVAGGGQLELTVDFEVERCLGSPGLLDLSAADGHVTGPKDSLPEEIESPPSVPDEPVAPTYPLKLENESARYDVGRIGKSAAVRAFDRTSGRVLWTSTVPDPYHDAFVASTSAAGLTTRTFVYLAYVVDSRDVSSCGGD